MAGIFPWWRQDYPLLSLINRGGFNGLGMKKCGFKVDQKPAPPFCFCHFFSPSLSLSALSHRPMPPPAHPLPAPP